MKKKILSTILIFTMLFSLLPGTAIPVFAGSGGQTETITSVEISITAPVKGAEPATSATVDNANCTVDSVSWNPDDTNFLGDVAYSATVVLTANDGYAFNSGKSTITATSGSITKKDISSNKKTATVTITFPETAAKVLDSISVNTNPDDLSYNDGETFNPEGLKLTLTYDDKSTEVMPYISTNPGKNSQDFSFDPSTITSTTTQVKVTYGEKEATINLNKTLQSISVNTNPTKLIYTANEDFDPTALVINAVYNTGSETVAYADHQSDFSFTKDNTTKKITITYGGKETTLDFTLKTVESIEIVSGPTKTAYSEGESFAPAGLVIKVTYNQGNPENITYSDATMSGFSFNPSESLGTSNTKVTVTYGGKTADVTISVTHKHNWNYNSSTPEYSGKLVASCTGAGTCPGDGKPTIIYLIAPSDKEYDGSDKIAGLYIDEAGTTIATSFAGLETLPEIEYYYSATLPNNENGYTKAANITDAGYYMATFKVGNKSAKIQYEITKRNFVDDDPAVFTVSMSDYTYGQTPSTPTNSMEFNVKYYYSESKTEAGTEWKDIAATTLNAGTYYMYAEFDGDSNNLSYTTERVEFKVNKVQLTISETSVSDKDYDGKTDASVTISDTKLVGVVQGDDVTVSATGVFEDALVGENKKVTVTYTVEGEDSGNYIAPVSDDTFMADIDKLALTITAPTLTAKTYDGTNTATVTIGTLSGWVQNETVTATVDTATFDDLNAGDGKTVTVKYTLSGEDAGNYSLADSTLENQSISKKNIKVTSGITATERAYKADDTSVTLVLTNAAFDGLVGNETVGVTATGAMTDADAGDDKEVTITYTGLTGDAAKNYELVTEGDGVQTTTTVNITKGQSTVKTAPNANTLTYNASAQELVTKGEAENGTMNYAIGENATTAPESGWGEAVPTKTNAGTYYVWYKSAGADNYADSTAECITVTIAKVEITVAAGDYKVSKTYDGTNTAGTASGELSVSGILDADSTAVSVTPGSVPTYGGTDVKSDYSLALPISITGDTNGNYKIKDEAETVTVTGEITKKDITGSVITLKGSALYADGTPKTQEVESVTLTGWTSTITYDVSGNVKTEAGTYSLTVTGNGNYEGTVSKTFIILTQPEEEETPISDKVEIPYGDKDGKVTLETINEEDTPETTIDTKKSEIINAVASAEDLNKVADGDTLTIWMNVNSIELTNTEEVPEEIKEEIENAAGGNTIVLSVDINVFKQLNDENPEPVTKTNAPLKITINIPEDQRDANAEYSIVRYHEGDTKVIKATSYDSETGNLTFETDIFSEYSVIKTLSENKDRSFDSSMLWLIIGIFLKDWKGISIVAAIAAIMIGILNLRKHIKF